VRDIMTTQVVTVGPLASVARVAQLMVQHNLTGVPVVKKDSVVGIVTDSDLVSQKSNIHPPQFLSAMHSFVMLRSSASVEAEITKLLGSKAEHIMTSPVISLKSSDLISRLATKMVETKANPIPIIDNGKLVGIVSRHDLLKLIAREQINGSKNQKDQDGTSQPGVIAKPIGYKPVKNGTSGKPGKAGKPKIFGKVSRNPIPREPADGQPAQPAE
jgi:CBS domain-containing protein